ncbi:MAG: hypothetical protein HKP55_11095 [Gammaproteobacteria bacterium]|nr:hypothetical protein [Gammaproteobacteria bacterium]
MSDEACAEYIGLYSEKIADAELLILDFKQVKKIESSGLLRMHRICQKINPKCDFRVVNANPGITHLLKFTPLGDYL